MREGDWLETASAATLLGVVPDGRGVVRELRPGKRFKGPATVTVAEGEPQGKAELAFDVEDLGWTRAARRARGSRCLVVGDPHSGRGLLARYLARANGCEVVDLDFARDGVFARGPSGEEKTWLVVGSAGREWDTGQALERALAEAVHRLPRECVLRLWGGASAREVADVAEQINARWVVSTGSDRPVAYCDRKMVVTPAPGCYSPHLRARRAPRYPAAVGPVVEAMRLTSVGPVFPAPDSALPIGKKRRMPLDSPTEWVGRWPVGARVALVPRDRLEPVFRVGQVTGDHRVQLEGQEEFDDSFCDALLLDKLSVRFNRLPQ